MGWDDFPTGSAQNTASSSTSPIHCAFVCFILSLSVCVTTPSPRCISDALALQSSCYSTRQVRGINCISTTRVDVVQNTSALCVAVPMRNRAHMCDDANRMHLDAFQSGELFRRGGAWMRFRGDKTHRWPFSLLEHPSIDLPNIQRSAYELSLLRLSNISIETPQTNMSLVDVSPHESSSHLKSELATYHCDCV